MTFTNRASAIWPDGSNVDKADVRQWGAEVEAQFDAMGQTFATRADAIAATILAPVGMIKLAADAVAGDGLGGVYVDTDNGSSDTFTSSGATSRTWYRAKTQTSTLARNQLIDAPRLVQKKLMEANFGFDNLQGTDTSIYTGSGFTSQAIAIVTVGGQEKAFFTQRCVADNYKNTERCRIVQFALLEDGSVGNAEVFSNELNIGHGAGLGFTQALNGDITFYSWMSTGVAHEDNDAGKGFSTITWRGASTDQTDVTDYQMFDWEASGGKRSTYYHADITVSTDGKFLVAQAYEDPETGRTNFHKQTVFVWDLAAVLAAGTPMDVDPLYIWSPEIADTRRAIYKQGLACNGEEIALTFGFINAFAPHVVQFYDMHGNLKREEFPTTERAVHGYDNLLDHATLGTPFQLEPEGICYRSKNELLLCVNEQWRTGADIVSFQGKNFACNDSGTDLPPFDIDDWIETTKAATAGAWSTSGSYSAGDTITKRTKHLWSIRAPQGDSGELGLAAGMYEGWYDVNGPLQTSESDPDIQSILGQGFQMRYWSQALNKYFDGFDMLSGYGENSRFRVFDPYGTNDVGVEMVARTNDNRKYYGMRATDGNGFLLFYGATDSEFPGQVVLKNAALDGWMIDSGAAPALFPDVAGSDVGKSTDRVGTVFSQSAADVSSDARLKTARRQMTGQEIEAGKLIARHACTYVLKADKSSGRHAGYIAQDVAEIMVSVGLDPDEYSFIAKDAQGFYSLRYEEINVFLARSFDARLSALEA